VLWTDQADTWCLGCCHYVGRPSTYVALGLMPMRWACPNTHVALAPHFGTSSAWVMVLDPRGTGSALGRKMNESCVRTQGS